jgi:hypothetical protein
MEARRERESGGSVPQLGIAVENVYTRHVKGNILCLEGAEKRRMLESDDGTQRQVREFGRDGGCHRPGGLDNGRGNPVEKNGLNLQVMM